jgi:hypothetical protein
MNAVIHAEPVPYTQLERMAATLAKSNMFGCKTADQAMSLLLMAQADGVHPARAMQEYHVIEGRPALRADAMLARFQAAGGRVRWIEMTDAVVRGEFSHPQAGSVEIDWTIERAKSAGLANRGPWKAYPRAMLRARCISEGVRSTFPGIAVGLYSAEETADIVADERERNVTPQRIDEAVASVAAAHPLTEDERFDHVLGMQEATDAASLRSAFSAAWKHASEAKDESSKGLFKATYDGLKPAAEVAP